MESPTGHQLSDASLGAEGFPRPDKSPHMDCPCPVVLRACGPQKGGEAWTAEGWCWGQWGTREETDGGYLPGFLPPGTSLRPLAKASTAASELGADEARRGPEQPGAHPAQAPGEQVGEPASGSLLQPQEGKPERWRWLSSQTRNIVFSHSSERKKLFNSTS